MSQDFADEFISKCIQDGLTKPEDICNLVLEKISSIDSEMERIHKLKVDRNNYQSVLKAFNHETIKPRQRKKHQPIVNFNISENFVEYKTILTDICSVIDEDESVNTFSLLIEKLSLRGEDTTPVYVAIKWLLSNDILKRNEENRNLLKGDKWNEWESIIDSCK